MPSRTLFEYYRKRGERLPPISERAKLYEQFGLGSASGYTGTAEQNIAFLEKLKAPVPTLATQVGAPAPTPAPSALAEGGFYQVPGAPEVYQYAGGQFRHVKSPKVAERLGLAGFAPEGKVAIEPVSLEELKTKPVGAPITEKEAEFPERLEAGTALGLGPEELVRFRPEYRPLGEVLAEERVAAEERFKVPEIESEIESASQAIKDFISQKPDSLADFNKEYVTVGLGNLKTRIATLDQDITTAKQERDQALTTEEGKPIPQWMITGRRRLIVEDAQRRISNLIDQRNSLADQYNQGLNEVTVKVGLKSADTQQQAQNLSSLLDLATGKFERVQKRITDILRGKEEAYSGELERLMTSVMAQQLPIQLQQAKAEAEAKGWKTQLVGRRLYAVNPATREWEFLVEAPETYAPPSSFKEWQLAGSPGTYEEWLRTKKEPTPGSSEDVFVSRQGLIADFEAGHSATDIYTNLIGQGYQYEDFEDLFMQYNPDFIPPFE